MAQHKLNSALEAPTASVQFEAFYFGLLVYQMCTPDAETIWKTNQADNMINLTEDSRRLAYHFEEMKLQVSSRIAQSGPEWSAAADLCLWCLQPSADRRPASMADVLHHPFFDADPEYHVTPAWKLHYPGRPRLRYVDSQQDDLATAVVGWANELHAAIQQDDVDVGVATVQRLLTSGCVHYGLCLQGRDL